MFKNIGEILLLHIIKNKTTTSPDNASLDWVQFSPLWTVEILRKFLLITQHCVNPPWARSMDTAILQFSD